MNEVEKLAKVKIELLEVPRELPQDSGGSGIRPSTAASSGFLLNKALEALSRGRLRRPRINPIRQPRRPIRQPQREPERVNLFSSDAERSLNRRTMRSAIARGSSRATGREVQQTQSTESLERTTRRTRGRRLVGSEPIQGDLVSERLARDLSSQNSRRTRGRRLVGSEPIRGDVRSESFTRRINTEPDNRSMLRDVSDSLTPRRTEILKQLQRRTRGNDTVSEAFPSTGTTQGSLRASGTVKNMEFQPNQQARGTFQNYEEDYLKNNEARFRESSR